jgi:uncharacterized protein with NRDE domain
VCTLTIAWQVFEDAPLVVAANRDERLDRPSEAPARRDWARPVIAPQDQEASGTWIGYNDAGVFAAVTNRWVDDRPDATRSRGLLVRDVLGYERAETAARYVEGELETTSYDGFNLLVADETTAVVIEWDGRPSVRTLSPGVHVVVNVGADGRYRIPEDRAEAGEQQAANADALRTHLQPEPGETAAAWLDRAAALVGDHDYGVCVHGDGYGTRSSSLLVVDSDRREFRYANGPPCETDYEPVSESV